MEQEIEQEIMARPECFDTIALNSKELLPYAPCYSKVKVDSLLLN
jgi:hypothetical protein